MRCRAWLQITEKTDKKGRTRTTLRQVSDDYLRRYPLRAPGEKDWDGKSYQYVKLGNPIPSGAELCGGNIIATVRAIDEPYFGGSSAELEVHLECDRCKNTFHGDDAPNKYNISALVTKFVRDMPDPYPNELHCPQCWSMKVVPTRGNAAGNTMDCLTCFTDFTP